MAIWDVDVSGQVTVEADTWHEAKRKAERREHWLTADFDAQDAWRQTPEPDPDRLRDEMTEWKYRAEHTED